MLESLKAQPQDKILQLIAMYRDDPRTTKIDLGVGVYKDATGLTPVMRAVKAAEKKLWEVERTKTYTGLAGEPAFAAAMVGMILGDGFADRAAAVATPGGTGAIRQALELIKLASPGATVWLSNPTWPNHPSIIKYLGMGMAEYRYFDAATCGIDFAGLMEDLGRVQPGDVVLLHGCCHNPTGANLDAGQWAAVVALLQALWRWVGGGCLWDAVGRGGVWRGVDCGVVQQEFRDLPGEDGDFGGLDLARPQGGGAGEPELSEPAELQFSAGSWGAVGDDDPGG